MSVSSAYASALFIVIPLCIFLIVVLLFWRHSVKRRRRQKIPVAEALDVDKSKNVEAHSIEISVENVSERYNLSHEPIITQGLKSEPTADHQARNSRPREPSSELPSAHPQETNRNVRFADAAPENISAESKPAKKRSEPEAKAAPRSDPEGKRRSSKERHPERIAQADPSPPPGRADRGCGDRGPQNASGPAGKAGRGRDAPRPDGRDGRDSAGRGAAAVDVREEAVPSRRSPSRRCVCVRVSGRRSARMCLCAVVACKCKRVRACECVRDC